VKAILASNAGRGFYDIVLVDPFHSYDCSMLDLLGAFCLVRAGGAIIVHDCNPDDPALVSSEFQPGNWCGAPYETLADFVQPRQHLRAYTVDCDYGCGVIFKPEGGSPAKDALALDWFAAKLDNAAERFAFFQRRRVDLVGLIDSAGFAATENLPDEELARRVS
jgi:hypothetical protein